MAQYVYKNLTLAQYERYNTRPNSDVLYFGEYIVNQPTWFELPGYYLDRKETPEAPSYFYKTNLVNQYINERAYTYNGDPNVNLRKCHVLINDFYEGKSFGAFISGNNEEDVIGDKVEYSKYRSNFINFALCDSNGNFIQGLGNMTMVYNSNPIVLGDSFIPSAEYDGPLNPSENNSCTYICFARNKNTGKLSIIGNWWTGDVNARIFIPFNAMKQGNPVLSAQYTQGLITQTKFFYSAGFNYQRDINFITINEAMSDYSGTSSGYGTWDTSSDDIGLP